MRIAPGRFLGKIVCGKASMGGLPQASLLAVQRLAPYSCRKSGDIIRPNTFERVAANAVNQNKRTGWSGINRALTFSRLGRDATGRSMLVIGDVTTKRRNSGIDLFRGLLVLAVILGHFSELTQRQSFLTWVGAGLRMPLFIGLTGYLFNLERARAIPLLHLMHKYQRRLVLPWLVACIVYLTVTEQLDILTPFSIFVQPPFHLWFVPVMMAFIVAATVVPRPPLVLLGIAIPISISAMYLFGVGHSVAQMPPWMPDRRFFIYPIYFFYGLWVACREPDPWKERAALVLALISFAWWCALYQAPSLTAEVAAELTSCLPLICLLPWVRRLSLSVPPIAGVGRDSLFFYLWHPMAFGLWAACGVHGLQMLMFSLLTLMAARVLLGSLPRAAQIFGLSPRPQPVTITTASPFMTPLQEPVQ